VPHPETGEASEELVAEILISEKLPPALAPPLVESPPSSFFAFPLGQGSRKIRQELIRPPIAST
jgi:hypothetical protein